MIRFLNKTSMYSLFPIDRCPNVNAFPDKYIKIVWSRLRDQGYTCHSTLYNIIKPLNLVWTGNSRPTNFSVLRTDCRSKSPDRDHQTSVKVKTRDRHFVTSRRNVIYTRKIRVMFCVLYKFGEGKLSLAKVNQRSFAKLAKVKNPYVQPCSVY